MEWLYPARFSDRHGSESALIHNDGANLSVVLRTVRFSGSDFDSLNAEPCTPRDLLSSFTFSPSGELWGCVFDIEMEVPLIVEGENQRGVLAVHLELGTPAPSELRLSLRVNSQEYCSEKTKAFFEDALQNLQLKLPEGIELKSCFCCAYSDYHPGGHGMFGSLGCFRNAKAEYSRVTNKQDILRIWNEPEFVQETYLCAEFSRREPNTGYRG